MTDNIHKKSDKRDNVNGFEEILHGSTFIYGFATVTSSFQKLAGDFSAASYGLMNRNSLLFSSFIFFGCMKECTASSSGEIIHGAPAGYPFFFRIP
ncbi:MAG: hypothetical protein KBC43_01970 [Bacteroidales bacterium]|nr:hypothetical protein [Bacteroidales bacterium]